MPDRIETATYLVATTMTGGEITIKNCQPNSLGAVITKLEEEKNSFVKARNKAFIIILAKRKSILE